MGKAVWSEMFEVFTEGAFDEGDQRNSVTVGDLKKSGITSRRSSEPIRL